MMRKLLIIPCIRSTPYIQTYITPIRSVASRVGCHFPTSRTLATLICMLRAVGSAELLRMYVQNILGPRGRSPLAAVEILYLRCVNIGTSQLVGGTWPAVFRLKPMPPQYA